MTLEISPNPEQQAYELNVKLTRAIFIVAEEYLKSVPRGINAFFKTDIDSKTRSEQLTNRVLRAINAK